MFASLGDSSEEEDVESAENFFNIGRNRPTKASKASHREKAIYGCFLDTESSESETEGTALSPTTSRKYPKRRRQGQHGKQGGAYDTLTGDRRVHFVSAGVVGDTQSSGKTHTTLSGQKGRAKNNGPSDSDEEWEDALRSVQTKAHSEGLDGEDIVIGYDSSSSGESDQECHEPDHPNLGSNIESPKAEVSPSEAAASSPSNEKSEDEDARDWRFRFMEMAKEEKRRRSEERQAKEHYKERKKGEMQFSLQEHKMLQMYGKGYKMLQKMGYSGGGLGKSGKGMTAPLTVQVREKYRGIQDVGEHKPHEAVEDVTLNGAREGRMSAVDILLGSQGAAAANGRGSRWQKGSAERTSRDVTRVKTVFMTSAERISMNVPGAGGAHDQLSSRAPVAEKPAGFEGEEVDEDDDDDELFYFDHGDDLSLADVAKSKSSKALRHRRKLMELKRFQATGQFPEVERLGAGRRGQLQDTSSTPTPLRIIDMTGPGHRVIEDYGDLQSRLAQANVAAQQATDKPQAFPATNSPSSETKSQPLGVLCHNLRAYIERLATERHSRSRLLVLQQSRLERAQKDRQRHAAKLEQLSLSSEALEGAIKRIEALRCSAALRHVEHALKPENGVLEHESVGDQFKSLDPLRQREAYRLAAVNKYAAPLSSHSIQKNEPAEKASKPNDLEQGHVGDTEEHTSTSALSVYGILHRVTSVFGNLRKKQSAMYAQHSVADLASRLALAVLQWHDSQVHERSANTEKKEGENPMHLTSILVHFRELCLPDDNASQLLRKHWNSVLQQRTEAGLAEVLSFMTVDPVRQDLKPLQTFFEWHGTILQDRSADLLKNQFFPKWLKVLKSWLASPEADFDEIATWYTGWKSVFPETLTNHKVVQNGFREGLEAIQNTLQELERKEDDGPDDTGCFREEPEEAVKFKTSSAGDTSTAAPSSHTYATINVNVSESFEEMRQGSAAEASPATAEFGRSIASASVGARLVAASRVIEVVQALSEERGILMIPKPGRMHNGRQIFAFGPLSIYADQGVLYCFSPKTGKWDCISLTHLLERAAVNE